jgi:RNA 3'-terminal phosphate cyclase
MSLNMHAKTNMEVIRAFLPVRFETVETQGRSRVSVQPE